jgi:hypothetical protein
MGHGEHTAALSITLATARSRLLLRRRHRRGSHKRYLLLGVESDQLAEADANEIGGSWREDRMGVSQSGSSLLSCVDACREAATGGGR